MLRTGPLLVATLIVTLSSGCGNSAAASLGMPDSTFVATLSELRRVVTDSSLDVTMADSMRRMILRRHKVTSAKLETAAHILAQSPTRASDLWRQVESIRASPRASAGTRPAPPPGNVHPVEH